jgi:hypothetical protein
MNDEGHSFRTIAAYIRANPDLLFEPDVYSLPCLTCRARPRPAMPRRA